MLTNIENKKIAFLCDTNLPNYIYEPKRYDYITGRHSATGYYYWILKNYGIKNVFLVSPDDQLDEYDVVVFHHDNKKCIETNKKYKTIQVLTDRPQVPNVDLYVCCNLSSLYPITNKNIVKHVGIGLKFVLEGKRTYVHYPIALNYKKCKASWPPKIFHYTGRIDTLINGLYCDKFINHMQNKGINLRFNFENDHNFGDEDVYFCIRKKTYYFSPPSQGNNTDTKLGQTTANRLYQSWKMGTPFIMSPTSSMGAIYKSEYDFLIADSLDAFEYQSLKLLNDAKLFNNMVENCKKRKDEHSNYQIVKQFLKAFEMVLN